MNDVMPDQMIVFNLDGEFFAIDVADVQEILPTTPCRSLPDTAAHVHGLMAYREQVIPVINLGTVLSLPPSGTEGNTIILRNRSRYMGLMVDEVDEVVTTGFKELRPAGMSIERRFVRSVIMHQEQVIVVLDSSELLSRLEV